MNNAQVSIDTHEVLNLFANLSSKEQNKSYAGALKKAANIVVKEAKKNLRSDWGKDTARAKNYWNGKTLESGITCKVNKNKQAATIHIMKDFRLRFLEKSTVTRKTAAGYNRGKITGTYFFKNAIQSKESEVFGKLNELISQSILRVATKKE